MANFSIYAAEVNIDGVLDEGVWQQADIISNFVTTLPYSLEKPDHKTEVRLFTNEKGIYIGITNFQTKESQLSNRSARDASINADYNNIIIDFDNSGVAAYRFSVGNGGSLQDGIFRNENTFSSEWDGIWYAKTTSDDAHWFAEVLIPWDVAPMVSTVNGVRNMGLHIERRVMSQQKTYASQGVHESRQRYLSDIKPVEIKDFSGSSLQTFVSVTAREDRVANDSTVDASVDLFWKPDSSKQLSITINPDFGHVDSDNLVVNFSPTETFFSENRAFFTENQSLFTLNGAEGLRLVHTRRIGGKPDSGDATGADIKGAVKFTSVDDQISYGFFSAIEDNDDKSKGRDFYTGRIMQKTDDYNVGYLMTYTDRPDIDRSAFVQAVDFGYFVSKAVTMSGQAMYSQISQNNTETKDSAAWLKLGQQFTETWEHAITAAYYGDEFQVNDLGFLPRNNLKALTYQNILTKHDFSDDSIALRHRMTTSLFYEENNEGLTLNQSIRYTDVWNLKDSSWGQWQLTFEDSAHDDLITRGNNVLNLATGTELDLLYGGDAKSDLRYHLHATLFNRTVSGKGYMLHVHPSFYFTDNYVLTLGLWYTKSDDWLLWQGDNRINSFQRNELTTRLDFNATIDDKQELSLRIQWVALNAKAGKSYFVDNNGTLNQFSEQVNDFSVSDTAIQIRYRYEIAPLSNIYLVYSRGGRQSLDQDLSFSSLFSPGWDKRDGDNLSLKVRYQF